MSSSEEKLLAELRQAFAIEAEEHLQAITEGLLELERNPDVEDKVRILEPVYRAAHSLKGAARAVNMNKMESLAHAMESLLQSLKTGQTLLRGDHFDILQDSLNLLTLLLSKPDEAASVDTASMIGQLQLAGKVKENQGTTPRADDPPPIHGHVTPPKEPPFDSPSIEPLPSSAGEYPSTAHARMNVEETPSRSLETVRINAAKLDSLLLMAEELLSVKQAIEQRANDAGVIAGRSFQWEKNWKRIDPDIRTLRHTTEADEETRNGIEGHLSSRLYDFLEWNHSYQASVESRLTELKSNLVKDYRDACTMIDGILEEAKELIMVPSSILLQRFPKMVRDIARDQNKKVNLSLIGGDVAIDRRILEELHPPLMHLLRNCIDHGIEKPEIRTKASKNPTGDVTVTVSKEGINRVLIEVIDDGAGIDLDKVLDSVKRQGVVSASESDSLTEEQRLALIFRSGVSTSSIITDLSGRGLGLAIVYEKVSQLGGNVSVESTPGTGTTFRISLPLTKATFRGTLVRLSNRTFVIPSTNLDRVVRIGLGNVKTVENREIIYVEKSAISLVRMHDVLKLAYPEATPGQHVSDTLPAVILVEGNQRIAFLVDEILAEQEILVKELGQHLAGLRCVSGATILGSGTVAPILYVPDLMSLAAEGAGAPMEKQTASDSSRSGPSTIVVVEDSLTSRTLLKNILESSGFNVFTAVDGLDGFRVLKTEKADLVVSDVEMPRMNGFELTEKIRADKDMGELPVVLVTAREKREDRERGVDAGANAYIVKSSFDQTNLLEVVRTLI